MLRNAATALSRSCHVKPNPWAPASRSLNDEVFQATGIAPDGNMRLTQLGAVEHAGAVPWPSRMMAASYAPGPASAGLRPTRRHRLNPHNPSTC